MSEEVTTILIGIVLHFLILLIVQLVTLSKMRSAFQKGISDLRERNTKLQERTAKLEGYLQT